MTEEVRDRLKRLLERGRKKGYILFAEFDELLPESADVGPELDYMLSAFESAGVEVVTEPGLTPPQFVSAPFTDDPVQVYIREVGNVPQFTRDRELELAKLLRTEGREAETAKLQLVESNLWRVVAVARRYADRTCVHILDLIQEGNKGLLRAAQTFDYSHGYPFSTYATWCARRAIIRAA
jgi:DNA-directed RNA polymerase sigma subunit (sigma70/sigma32)